MNDLSYEWKAWYSNGDTFDSTEGEPWESPDRALVVITQPCAPDESILRTEDFFIYLENKKRWMEVDIFGLIDHLSVEARYITCVRTGWREPVRDDFVRISDRAVKELRG